MAPEIATAITNLARQKYGDEGARVVGAILQVEGGLTGNVGDNGSSFGPFQFHKQGMLPGYARARGLTLEQAAQKARTDPLDAAGWALDNYLGQTLAKGLQAGLKGSRLATYVQQYGQRSQKPERAGQVYQSMYGSGSQEGKSNVMPREEEQERSPQDTAVANYEKKIAKWEEEKTEAEAKLAPLREKIAQYDPNTWDGRDSIAAIERQAKPYTDRINSLDNNIRNAMAQMERIRTQKDQRYAEERQRQQDDMARQDKALEAYKDLVNLEILSGNKTYDQGMARFNNILDLAKQGMDVTDRILQATRQAAPMMGTPATRAAYQNLLRGWNQFIPNAFPEGDFLPMIDYNPQQAYDQYKPPPGMIDWSQAQQGLLQAQGAYDEVPDVMGQYRQQALMAALPPEEPSAPPPDQAWQEAMLNQQATGSQPPPGSSQVAPLMPPRTPPPYDWRAGLLDRTPAPSTPSSPNATVPMDPEMARYAQEAAANFSQRQRPAAAAPTAVPTPQPTAGGNRSEAEILNDPTLSPEEQERQLDELFSREYGQ